ncbi:MAG: MMPL family transporter [Candidatus Altiarchaeum hamiconexum]|uniref:MMPL family transporter n=2 Tax=Candidatus Altarchaeum hamiconexum TaxID=1803513 RepID=A0A8J7YU20_9ARCH|nr:MMPL family transporter [Candidatus Altarchaeum hamiconexum]OIQ05143.1 MAG: hypothetical protein AUK59_04915 [Candidatus Altarchaeum sp. CG2_30_32_3053]PIN67133.1 MAG: hypothetical protein COV98_04520 [Candidatus Altarchaeum sp. CG12_big_fil_rev_8_21_14_0_65_33_22]PIV27713.1 MAG: hypothetical protein COS36_04800 [Candidatus Altarchaeum sp. CG03_land_8_20_14_0_80_32_618]PIZ30463.1 MAG: hypothetical protein COY41_03950 [Candidatus Altarchaeum sp. CG_4_10_14_0_8_um_filter_32_851]PJC13758.1 MAG
MRMVEDLLEKVAGFCVKHAKEIFLIAIIVTIVMLFGITLIELQTDISNFLSESASPVVKLDKEVSNKFGEDNGVIISFKIDKKTGSADIYDIRDIRVIKSVVELTNKLKAEDNVKEVRGIGNFFENYSEQEYEKILNVILNNPASKKFFNRDYTQTLIFVTVKGKSQKEIDEIVKEITADIDKISVPEGVTVSWTGEPILMNDISNILMSDMIKSFAIAAFIVLILLFLIYRSWTKGLLPYVPLMISLIWTLGTMGYIGIPISIATVAVAPMIIGIGIEFGVFVVNRYFEELNKGIARDIAIQKGVSGVGIAVLASTTALTIAFIALGMGDLTIMKDMGIALAIGIIYAMFAALFINPAFIVIEDKIMGKNKEIKQQTQ